MQTCSKCNTQSSDMVTHCPNCGSDLSEFSKTAVARRRYQENPRVQYIRVVVAADSCPACQQVEGAYAKGECPELPVETCSHSLGCRCFYQPFLNDIYP